jgi:hypothetical protein
MQLFYFHAPDEVPMQPSAIHADEDFWQNPVAPIPFTLQRLDAWTFEQNESPGLFGQYGDDYVVNLVAPLWCYPLPQLFTSEEPITAPAAILGIDEDFLVITTSPMVYALPRVFTADDEIVPTPPMFDEDFWSNAVAPVFSYTARVFLDDDVIQIEPPARDEDYWQNGVAPIAASIYLLLPYLPDVEEIPAGFLVVTADPDVLGSGAVAVVSGAGVVSTAVGAGQVGLASGEGGINE